jgi:Mg2+ and Co2+ transporter CorA
MPILKRLTSPDTVLRQCCDASMLLQALIDGIIDLAIPIATAYQEIIGELELNVLTEPSIIHTTNLYILTSEMTKIRNFVSPALNLINALREHKESTLRSTHSEMTKSSGVKISPLAQTYFGDVEDHIILITDGLDSMRHTCDNMIDLIFNTIAAYQNESMKQLTIVTILFLPLTFITGYFGMNITDFPSIHHSESYFWIVAAPVGVAVALFLMKDIIKWYFTRMIQRRLISKNRKGRLLREKHT